MYARTVLFAALVSNSALAASGSTVDPGVAAQLRKLMPEEQLEQRCDMEAMRRISAEKSGFRPDKVIAYTFSDPEVDDNFIRAPGAVFRSEGEWYRLKYTCRTGPENLVVKAFDYRIGARVERDEWERYYLYE